MLACLLLLFPALFIFQGLDFTDMGYVLVSSRDTLSDPGNLPSSATFLSMFINGLWMRISAPWGLLGARAGVVLVYWVIFSSSYIVLKDFMRAQYALFTLLLTFNFTQRTFWISYNHITSLVACVTIAILYSAFKLQNKALYILSGALCALAFFARFPNILMIGFGFLPLIAQIAVHDDCFDKGVWKNTALFFVGYGAMCLFVVAVMMLTGYWTHYARSFIDMAELASGDSIYSSASLLTRFIEDHKRVFSLGVVVVSAGTGCSLFLDRCRLPVALFFPPLALFAFFMGWEHYRGVFNLSKLLALSLLALLFLLYIALKNTFFPSTGKESLRNNKNFLIFCILLLLALVVSLNYLDGRRATLYDPVFGATYILLLIGLFSAWRAKDRLLFFALLGALAIFITVPLGSGNGIRNATHALWLALPLSLKILWQHGRFLDFAGAHQARSATKHTIASSWIKGIVMIFLVATGSAIAFRYTYRDTSDRLSMRYSIDHPMLRGIYTTKERAAVVQEVLDELEHHVRPGDFLLGFHTVSTLYYLTETRPYLYSSWPFLYQPEKLKRSLEKAKKERPELPVAVRSKYSLQNFEWPLELYQNPTPSYRENLKIMDAFLKKESYEKHWENKIFEIWIPPLKGRE